MKKLFLLILGLCQIARAETYVYGTNLNMTGGGFGPYSGTDAPYDCFIGWMYAGTNQVTTQIYLPVTETDPHQLFLNFLDFDYHQRASIPDYSTNEITLDYRTVYSGRWSRALLFTNATAITNVTLQFRKTNDPGTSTRMLLMGVFATTNMTATVDRDGYLKDWTYPTVMNSNPPVKINVMHDSSFEGRGNEGWGISKQSRTNFFLAAYNTNTNYVYHGDTSLRVTNETTAVYYSRIYRLQTNTQYTISGYVRTAAGTLNASVGLINAFTPPTGLGLSNQQWVEASGTITTNWSRLSATAYMLDYPEPEFRITLRVTSGTAQEVYFDAIQLEQGTNSAYAPADNVEFGLVTEVPGNIYTNTSSAALKVNLYNHAATSEVRNLNWRITDSRHKIVLAGVTNLTVSPGRSTYTIQHSVAQRGWFCLDAWFAGVQNSGDEMQYCILSDETGPIDDFGGHVEWTLPRNAQIMARLGAKIVRGLSTTQFGRWTVAQPTVSTYAWADDAVTMYRTNGLTLIQNLGENVPSWAARTYFLIDTLVGNFSTGERIYSGGNTGTITAVFTTNNIMGNALQLSNVIGSFTSNTTITGESSGATARISSTPVSGTPGLPEFYNFVTNFATHYGTNIPEIEIWNEPNLDSEIPKPSGSLAFYAELLKNTVAIYKSIAPTVLLTGLGGVATSLDISNVVTKLDSATISNLSRLSVHLYDYNALSAWGIYTNSTSYGKPVDNTETGIYDKGSYVGWNSPRKTEGYPVSYWNDLEWRIKPATESPLTTARNIGLSRSGGLSRYIYYDFRYSGQMPETAGAASNPSSMDYDDTIISKGVVAQSIMRMTRGFTGTGPVTMANSNVWCYGWSNSANQSLFMIWGTNNSPWTLTLTNTVGNLALIDVYSTTLLTATNVLPIVRMPQFVRTGNAWATMTNLLRIATITAATDTEPPTARITICPSWRVETNSEVLIKWMGTDRQTMPTEALPELLKFSYRLLGYNTNWSTPSAVITTTYNDLPIGQYTFQLRAQDSAGNISPVDSRAFSVGTNYPTAPRTIVGSASSGTFRVLQ